MADFSEAMAGIDQGMLDSVSDLGDLRKMASAAFLKLGALHGVTVEIEPPLGEDGDVPFLVRQGLVIRVLLPKGIDAAGLTAALAEGEVARLAATILEGHRLSLAPEGGTGQLSRGAERARSRLMDVLGQMVPASVPAPRGQTERAPNWRRATPPQMAAA